MYVCVCSENKKILDICEMNGQKDFILIKINQKQKEKYYVTLLMFRISKTLTEMKSNQGIVLQICNLKTTEAEPGKSKV